MYGTTCTRTKSEAQTAPLFFSPSNNGQAMEVVCMVQRDPEGL